MITAATEASRFACCEKPVDGLPTGRKNPTVQIGVNAAQRFARHNVELYGDQRPFGRVQYFMRFGCADQFIT